MILNSPGILQFYESLQDQLRNRSFSIGESWPAVAPIASSPPWQLVVSGTMTTLTTAEIINADTGTATDVLAGLDDAGYLSEGYTDADGNLFTVLAFPGKAPIPGAPTTEATYYWKIADDNATYYSEVFRMCDSLEGYHKITWCHAENFDLPATGHILYISPSPGTISYNYEMFVYLRTEIVKPQWKYEEEVEKRDGRNFPLKQTRWKEMRLEAIWPEHMIEAMSFAPLHDSIKITTPTGKELDVDELTFTVNWQEQGDVAAVEIVFRTDTVIVINARALTTQISCAAVEGTCLANDYTAVAKITEGSSEYTGGYYTDADTGLNVNFLNGDYIVVEQAGGGYILAQFSAGPTYTTISTVAGDNIFEANTGAYYQHSVTAGAIITNEITNVVLSGPTVIGTACDPGTVSVYGILYGGIEYLIGVVAADVFTGMGFDFEAPLCLKGVRIDVANGVCGTYYSGDQYDLGPFDTRHPLGNYDNTDAAIAAGKQGGDLYALTAGNSYGLPDGLVIQIPPLDGGGYISRDAGETGVGRDCMFALRSDNIHGMPEGTIMISAFATPTYTDDADAAAGGVLIEEIYAYDGTTLGLPFGLVKKRIT